MTSPKQDFYGVMALLSIVKTDHDESKDFYGAMALLSNVKTEHDES
jgi:hypothetical protein